MAKCIKCDYFQETFNDTHLCVKCAAGRGPDRMERRAAIKALGALGAAVALGVSKEAKASPEAALEAKASPEFYHPHWADLELPRSRRQLYHQWHHMYNTTPCIRKMVGRHVEETLKLLPEDLSGLTEAVAKYYFIQGEVFLVTESALVLYQLPLQDGTIFRPIGMGESMKAVGLLNPPEVLNLFNFQPINQSFQYVRNRSLDITPILRTASAYDSRGTALHADLEELFVLGEQDPDFTIYEVKPNYVDHKECLVAAKRIKAALV